MFKLLALQENNNLLKTIEKRITHMDSMNTQYINHILLKDGLSADLFEKPTTATEGGKYPPELAELKAVAPHLYTYIANIVYLLMKGTNFNDCEKKQ